MCAGYALYGGHQRKDRQVFQVGGREIIFYFQPWTPVWKDYDDRFAGKMFGY
jgi:hypothetical protein